MAVITRWSYKRGGRKAGFQYSNKYTKCYSKHTTQEIKY